MRLFRRLGPYILLACLLAANIFAWSQRQQIADWWRLRDYQPSAEIAALVADTAMTPLAERLFYVNHPQLEDRADFNMHCADKREQTAVLGCYHGNRQGIYIYAVTDSRLAGVRQVTAAHEMLHQAYDRLSSSEHQRISNLLEAFYNRLKNDAIKAKIESYKKQPNVDLANEMHSIFGSEVRDLPQELEAYYSRYFTERSKVVSLSEAYQGEFTRRQELVKQYDAELSRLKAQITTNKAALESDISFLRSKEDEISQDVANRDQAAYNADVRDYNSRVTAYNSLLVTTRGLIEQHNSIVGKRNEIAVQEQQLQQALDSRLETPTPKQ